MANHSRRQARASGKSSTRTRHKSETARAEVTPSFSLREVARSTERNNGWWATDQKLRHKTISFVQGGSLHGDKPPPLQPGEDIEDRVNAIEIQKANDCVEITQNTMALRLADDVQAALHRTESPINRSPQHFHTTAVNLESCNTIQPASRLELDPDNKSKLDLGFSPYLSPTHSSSSDDIVLFKGRGANKTNAPHRNQSHIEATTFDTHYTSESRTDCSLEPLIGQVNLGSNGLATSSHASKLVDQKKSTTESCDAGYDSEGVLDAFVANKRTTNAVWDTGVTPWESRSKPGIGWEKPHDTRKAKLRKPLKGTNQNQIRRDKTSNESSDEAIADYIANMKENGEQLTDLVAQPFSVRALSLDDAGEFEIGSRDSNRSSSKSQAGVASESFSSEDTKDDDDDEDENDDDSLLVERDLIQRRLDRLTDEEIAHALAKQEEFGFSADELVLFDDSTFDSDIGMQSFEGPTTLPLERSAKRHQKKKRAKDNYPSASLFADVLEQDPYGGFDIMDFDRPSLKKKKKGRHSDLLEAEAVEAQLQDTWEEDRKKKGLQRLQRQELREQGLIGKKNKFKPDLRKKYSVGLSSIQLLKELKEFWESTLESRAFPPMDKKDRKALHEIAQRLNMTSKSRGSGKNRFPVLNKTMRTSAFDENIFARLEKNMEGGTGGFTGPTNIRNSAASYKNGEVVGAGAPELGSDNKGRAMLEKMGWTRGTALGTISNKGILVPITHVFKSTKHGLR